MPPPPMPSSPARKPMSKPPATRAEASVAISLKGRPEIMGSVQREGSVNAAADYRGICGFAIADLRPGIKQVCPAFCS